MGNFLLDKFKQNSRRFGQGSQFSDTNAPTSYFEYMRGAVNPNLVGGNVNNSFNPSGEIPVNNPPTVYILNTESGNILTDELGNSLIA